MKRAFVLKPILVLLFALLCSPFAKAQEVIYYCANPAGAYQVFRQDLASLAIDTITDDPAHNYWWVQLSHDKSELLMMRSPVDSLPDQFNYNVCEVVISAADGSNPQVLVADNQYGWFAFGNPQWHPDGDRILMIAQPGTTTAPFHVFTIDTLGNNPNQLMPDYGIDANWSRQGDKIVFIGIDSTGFVDLTDFEVFTADYDHGTDAVSNISQLTSDPTRNHDPCFSPDGSKIVFSASPNTIINADLISIDANGANRTTLLDDNGIHGGPLDWAPDGRIYHHSLYLSPLAPFTANAFNTNTLTDVTLLSSPTHGHISPYYANLTVTAFEEPAEQELVIYPNPGGGGNVLTVELGKPFDAYRIRMVNVKGEEVLNEEGTGLKKEIDTRSLGAGVYFLNIEMEGTSLVRKFVKGNGFE